VLAGAPYLRSAHVDASVLGVGAVLVALALLPSVVIAFADVARLPLHAALKSGAASARAGSRLPLGGAPVVLQVALAVVLLVGAVLMTRSVGRLLSVPLGFQPDHVVAMSVSLPVERYQTPESVAGFYRDLRSQAARLPGVARVGIVDEMPLTKDTGAVRLHTADRPAASSAETEALIRSASPGYFETMGIAILAGRDFAETDRDGRPPVAVLSRALASALFPGGQAVGRSVALARNTITFQVAGVVDDVRMGELDRTIRPAIYTCSLQDPSRSTQALVRTTRPAAEMASELRAVVRTIDPDVPVYRVRTMEEALGDTQGVATRRLVLYPLAAFGGLTALIAMFGLYGLLSYAMAQRTRELGIRVALGAETPAILRLAMGQGLGPALTGVVLGLALAAAGTRWLAGVLYGVGPFDAASFAGAAGLVLVISAAAAFVPARRASRVDPCVVLRME
jgi:putative ABC transport system permease protein